MFPPAESENVRRGHAATRIVEILRAAAGRDLVDHRGALAEIDELAEEFANDPQLRMLAEGARSMLAMATGSPLGDPNTIRVVLAGLDQVNGGDPSGAQMMALMPDFLDMWQEVQDGESATAFAMFPDILARSRDLPLGNPLREALEEIAPMIEFMGAPDGERPSVPAAGAGVSGPKRALQLMIRGGMAMRMGAETDLFGIDTGIDDLREAVALTIGHPDHVISLASLAFGLNHRSQVTGSLTDVDEAITLLERARDLAGGAEHPHWSFVNDMLAGLRRRRGDAPPARLAALEGLRGYTWRVLLQPDPASARTVAREAAAEAMATAVRCLTDHRPADALRALDAGRGLMLFATTELRDPYTRLCDAGARDLADQWRAADRPPPRLREDVLGVLTRNTGLLDPPSLDEIQGALRRLGIDALVYLVPGDAPMPGWAVIAPAAGPPQYLALPHLLIEKDTDIERYLSAMATRDPTRIDREVEQVDAGPFTDSVEALCGWAWKVAMRPLAALFRDLDHVPRLVLIPMGDLARVPWQAARDPDGTYLVQRFALSQAASARMLCDTAVLEPVRMTSGGMVLADPDTGGRASSLRSARLEAYAIHRTFYPGARYVGRRPDGSVSRSGAGTPDDVRGWLRLDDVQAGTMLHLASHGVTETARTAASSRLVLAGGDLAADELVGIVTRADRRSLGLVVLAACHTGRSVHGYDEAYSLGTMFLAAGARSVLSTQWSVPDQDTSLLMYMFHHFVAVERRAPWDALRRAQLWMLDPDRQPPPHMPRALRHTLADSEPARVVAWAGFVHWGQ